MADANDDFTLPSPPPRVSVPAASRAAPRRLSCRLRRATPAAARRPPPAWVSLQGRLLGAEAATSAAAVGGGLSVEAAATWELFSPLHRVLIVAVAAAAAQESERERTISQLKRSVDLRDRVLERMQQKLEDLWEQMNFAKDSSIAKIPFDGMEQLKLTKYCSSEYMLDLEGAIVPLQRIESLKLKDFDGFELGGDEVFKGNQQEERRMSDLSDICSSVTSSVDIQLSSLAAEQEIYNLRKELEEKDAAMKDLTDAAHVTRAADAKRIAELEEIIKRKSLVINKLKKDMVVFEQKVIQLTRERRSSTASNLKIAKPPAMANNLLYDMSSTSPSSSDSDSPTHRKECHSQGSLANGITESYNTKAVRNRREVSVESLGSFDEPSNRLPKQHSLSPSNYIRRVDPSVAPRPKRLVSSGGEFKRTKRQTRQEPKGKTSQRRWV